jgi:hypothetical protein
VKEKISASLFWMSSFVLPLAEPGSAIRVPRVAVLRGVVWDVRGRSRARDKPSQTIMAGRHRVEWAKDGKHLV